MTEKLNEKLQATLTKLEKLGAIQKSVEILQETLKAMDSKIQSLASAKALAYRDINDLKESESFYEYKQHTRLKMSELEQKWKAKLQNLKTKISLSEGLLQEGKH